LAVLKPGDDKIEGRRAVTEQERRALNEALFRDVNERIAESAERVDENRNRIRVRV
jgi:hypothetical protein